jgi:outer membrane protein insertion porin family
MHLGKVKIIRFSSSLSLFSLLFFLNSCADLKRAIVHNYPKEKAFIYTNKIIVKDAASKHNAKELSIALDNYWDDSIKVQKIRQYGFFNTIIKPQTYQPERMSRTIQYMSNFLATEGYHHPLFTPIITTDTVKREWRTTVTMEVQLNQKTLLDTIAYQLSDPILQNIVLKNSQDSYLRKGQAFSNLNINNELDRLVTLFRANGFFNFTKEKIFAEVDTIDASLMVLQLDPLSQITQITEAKEKKNQNPSWKISIQLRNLSKDITKQYKVGQQLFYSDLGGLDNPDSLLVQPPLISDTLSDLIHYYTIPKFKSSLFKEQAFIQKGSLFNETNYYQTLNKLSGLGAWQQVDGRNTMVNDSVYLHYFLVPSMRRSVNFDIEGSRNTAQLGSGNLLGLSTNLTYRDKNVQRKAIPSVTSLRLGVELNLNSSGNVTQTLLWNVGQTYSFPNLIMPFVKKEAKANQNVKTNFALYGSYMDRLDYYQLKSFTTNWGYEWKKNKNGKQQVINYHPLNIEFYQLNRFSKLDSLLIKNPFLRSSFNEGNIVSQTLSYTNIGPSAKHPRQQQYLRLGIEDAGGLFGLSEKLNNNLYRYLKLEAEYRSTYKYANSEFAWRLMGGWGNNYSSNASLSGQLPFFKQFTAGGPYSMRAWGLRQLGLGSSTFYDTSASRQNFDRFGDLQLEANIEYRFTLLQFGSYKIGSALFTDIGNIWNTRDLGNDIRAGFKLDRLYKDLAIGVGTGLRVDFDYFIIRVDYALKMKDPTRSNNNGWLNLSDMKWSEIKANGIKVNNYAWQFGIGLPF